MKKERKKGMGKDRSETGIKERDMEEKNKGKRKIYMRNGKVKRRKYKGLECCEGGEEKEEKEDGRKGRRNEAREVERRKGKELVIQMRRVNKKRRLQNGESNTRVL